MRWFRPKNRALAHRVPDGGLRRYLATEPPARGLLPAEIAFLAVDFETTGLDPATDSIIAVGHVDVDGLAIPLGTVGSFLVDPGRGVGQSAVIHRLTDDRLAAEGVEPAAALDRVFDALTGRILLAHHAAIEVGFLAAAVEAQFGISIEIPAVDTMLLGQRALGDDPPPGALRLWKLRARAGLPSYVGHDAAVDALGCAELYLALVQELAPKDLGSLLRWS